MGFFDREVSSSDVAGFLGQLLDGFVEDFDVIVGRCDEESLRLLFNFVFSFVAGLLISACTLDKGCLVLVFQVSSSSKDARRGWLVEKSG